MAKSAYEIIRRPVITEKGLGVKETEHTLVFEVSVRATAWGAVDVPFEGVFDLRSVEIEK